MEIQNRVIRDLRKEAEEKDYKVMKLERKLRVWVQKFGQVKEWHEKVIATLSPEEKNVWDVLKGELCRIVRKEMDKLKILADVELVQGVAEFAGLMGFDVDERSERDQSPGAHIFPTPPRGANQENQTTQPMSGILRPGFHFPARRTGYTNDLLPRLPQSEVDQCPLSPTPARRGAMSLESGISAPLAFSNGEDGKRRLFYCDGRGER